jgi:hypothetical protein
LLSRRQSGGQSGIARADHDHVVNLSCHSDSTSWSHSSRHSIVGLQKFIVTPFCKKYSLN